MPARTAAKKQAAQDSMEILANLDLSRAADSNASMCPKCGADIPEDASECPQCGVDPSTGQLTEAAKRRLGRKGPDPSEFYSIAWKDGWRFTVSNMRIVLRTAWYAIFWYGIAAGCFFMAVWSTRLPPKFFWMSLTVVSLLVFPGWLWFLRLETIRTTVTRKTNISDRSFDVFKNIELGLTEIVWKAVFGFTVLPAVMYPLAMIHLAMPVTKKGWRFFSMLPVFFRNVGPTLYYWVFEFVLNLPAILIGAGIYVLSAHQFIALLRALNKGESVSIRWPILVGAILLAILWLFWFSFSSIYLMRVIGQIAYYFRHTLDLVTVVPEKEYIRKVIKLDAFGNPVLTRGQKMAHMLVPIAAILVLVVVGFVIYRQIFGEHSG